MVTLMSRRSAIVMVAVCTLGTGVSAQRLEDWTRASLERCAPPATVAEFSPLPHLPPVNQDTTSSCWSFATLSFIESEMLRRGLDSVRLSPMFAVYCAFLDKSKYYVAARGASRFAPGDLFMGVWETAQRYGVVPMEAYRGQTRSCATYNHDALYAELDSLMKDVRSRQCWDESTVLADVRRVLDRHLGIPPQEFSYRGRRYTPMSFAREVVRIPWDGYVNVTSFLSAPYYRTMPLDVPDNWKRDSTFVNVPLDLFYRSIANALAKGYTVAIDADISEIAYRAGTGAVVVPDFDIPAGAITPEAREYRFVTGLTTDDHLMHVVGMTRREGKDWFLVKDSWRTAWRSSHPGYIFSDETYFKLKVLAYLVAREAVPEITARLAH